MNRSLIACALAGMAMVAVAGCGPDGGDDDVVDAAFVFRDARVGDGTVPDGGPTADAMLDAPAGDTTAPAAVTLAAGTPTTSAVTLTWTATGDDGNVGTAASYDLRYRTGAACPLTAANFAGGTAVTGLPAPMAAGGSESFMVTGLSPATTYCFAMIVRDERPNASPLSNVVNVSIDGTTAQQITALRTAVAAVTASPIALPSVRVNGAVVSYIKAAVGGAMIGSADGPGFFLQNDDTGPAIFVAVDPTIFIGGGPVALGDRLSLTVTEARWLSCGSSGATMCNGNVGMHVITAATGTRTATAQTLPMAQDLSAVAITVPIGNAPWEYEHELVRVTGALPGTAAFVSAGTGFQSAQITTAGNATASADLLLRVPDALLLSTGLAAGCNFTVNGAPMWRFASAAQVSAWTSTDLTVSGCPTTAVVATIPADATTAVSVDGTIGVQFNVPMDPATLTAQTVAGPCTGSVQVSTEATFTNCISMASATPTLSANNTIANFIPSPHLSFGSTYKVRVLATASAPGTGRAMAADFTSANGFSTGAQSASCTPDLVISQVYGGGGNASATYRNDFIELHNRGTAAVSLMGMSVQYASATGTAGWLVTTLPNVMVMPGQFFLVGEGNSGGTMGVLLPTADHTGTLDMSATAGKVALVNTTVALSGACPTANIRDLVGYGTTANCREGMPATTASNAPAGSNILSNQRAAAGCTDTQQNSTDFAAATPLARNTSTAVSNCTCAATGDRTANESGVTGEMDFCNLQPPATLTVAAGATSAAVLGSVYEPGVTEPGMPGTGLVAQVGVGPASANPENQTGWTWSNGTFVQQTGTNNNDRQFTGTFTAPATAGSYRYTYRFSVDGTTWTYCDLNGAGSNPNLTFETTQLGVLTVP